MYPHQDAPVVASPSPTSATTITFKSGASKTRTGFSVRAVAVAVARLLCSAYVRVQTTTARRPSGTCERPNMRSVERYSLSGRWEGGGEKKYHNKTGWAERFDDRRTCIYLLRPHDGCGGGPARSLASSVANLLTRGVRRIRCAQTAVVSLVEASAAGEG